MTKEITRYDLYVGEVSLNSVQVSMERKAEGEFVRHQDMMLEIDIATDELREMLNQASELLGMPLNPEIDALRMRIGEYSARYSRPPLTPKTCPICRGNPLPRLRIGTHTCNLCGNTSENLE